MKINDSINFSPPNAHFYPIDLHTTGIKYIPDFYKCFETLFLILNLLKCVNVDDIFLTNDPLKAYRNTYYAQN